MLISRMIVAKLFLQRYIKQKLKIANLEKKVALLEDEIDAYRVSLIYQYNPKEEDGNKLTEK